MHIFEFVKWSFPYDEQLFPNKSQKSEERLSITKTASSYNGGIEIVLGFVSRVP